MYYQTCIECGVTFGMPEEFNDQLLKNGNTFYCPSGHKQHYIIGKTEEQKLKERLKYKESCCTRLESAVKHQDHVINGYKGQITKIKNKKITS